jgi:outer membrane protein assembly factor BamB
VEWNATKNVAWKQPLPGEGWSSPVVFQGRIYLTAAVPLTSARSYSLRFIALDEATGKQQFDVEIFQEDGSSAPAIHRKNSHASPTPLIADNRVYVHFGHQGTACLDLKGKILWQNRELKYPPVHGAGGTPILVGRALIFSCDGSSDPFIAALDAQTGKLLWKTPRESDAAKKFSFSTPTLITVDGKPQVISPGSNMVCALDPQSGKEIWRVRYEGYSVIPKPIFGQGLLFVCTGYDKPTLIAVRPGGQGDLTDTNVVWTATRSVPHTASLLLVDDLLFMVSDDGFGTCLDAKTGSQVWKERLGGNYSASPLYANGLLYFCNEEGTTTVVKAGRQFEKVAENPIEERTLASFAVAGDSLLIRGDKHLFRIGTK